MLERFQKKKPQPVEEDEGEEVVADSQSEEIEDAPVGWQAKLRAQLPILAKLIPQKKSVSRDRTDGAVKAPPSATQKQKIIRLVVGLGIAYLLFDTFMPTEEPVVEEPAVATKRPPRKNRRPRPTADAPAAEAPGAEAPLAETPAAGAPAAEAPVAETPTAETPPQEPPSDIFAGEDLAPIEATSPETTNDNTPVTDTATGDAPPDPEPSNESADPVATGGEGSTTDQVTETVPVGGEDMTDKILQDLEEKVRTEQQAAAPAGGPYSKPPSYDFPGRGLVYNCLGKHWACVDGGSYQVCQQNYRALQAENRRKECFPDSVYETQQGCAWVQKQKVSNTAKTDFCN